MNTSPAIRTLNQLAQHCIHRCYPIALGMAVGTIAASTAWQASADSLLVGDSNGGGVIRRYDSATGAYLGVFASGGGLTLPQGLAWGPDGNLYVANFSPGTVLRYSGRSGAFLGVFASAAPAQIADLTFCSKTNLFVVLDSGAVHRFSAVTGASLGEFIPAFDGGLGGILGSGNSLFVTRLGWNGAGGQLLYYSGLSTNYLLDTLYTDFSSNGPRSPRWGPDNNLYVPDWQTPHVAKFQGLYTGYVGNIVNDTAHLWPIAVEFSSDGEGLFVLEDNGIASSVNRYNLGTGAFETQLIPPGSGGLGRANCMLLIRDLPPLLLTGASSEVGSELVQLAWTNNGAACVLETSAAVNGDWVSIYPPLTTNGNWISTAVLSQDSSRFFRLRLK